jgi:hypothetical protein
MGELAVGASARLLAGLSREKKKISQLARKEKPEWGCLCVRSLAPTGKRQKRLIRWVRMYLKRKANTI